ncbi:MAG: hypothetical protein HYU76_11165 [Betaproteobacteria bacterium]|nr:hypothetical protein [Betaproteobacteria bacterium]
MLFALLGGKQGPQDQNPSPVSRGWSAVSGQHIILGRGGKMARKTPENGNSNGANVFDEAKPGCVTNTVRENVV